MNTKFKKFLIREGFMGENEMRGGVSIKYLQAVMDVFLDPEYYGTAEQAEISTEEFATIAQCESEGKSPEECAIEMKKSHRWQVDR